MYVFHRLRCGTVYRKLLKNRWKLYLIYCRSLKLGTFSGQLSGDTIYFGSCVGTFEEHALCMFNVEG